jgi:hypothetical protein
VHYVRWELSPVQVDSFAAGPVTLALDHPAYRRATLLTEANRQELLDDLRS